MAIRDIDLAILVAYLAGVVVFGLWMGRGQRNVSDYLLGGRDLPWWAVLLSIVATETSTVTFLSVPGIAYAQGGDLRFLQLTFGYILGRWAIIYLFLPHYFRGDLFTAYEVLERRFGRATKQAASVLFLLARNLADGLRLFLTAMVLQNVVGLPLSWCIVVLGTLTIIYTFVGGMKSVIWNDCIQFAVYILGGVLAGIIIADHLPGGWEQWKSFAWEHDKFRVIDLSPDLRQPFTLWAGVVGGFFLTLGTHGTDQMMVQRYLAARSQGDAGRALAISGLVVCAQFALFLVLGVGLACFYLEHPPTVPFAEDANDEVFARFIVDFMPVGVLGITLAAVFSAAMSTLSSSLNSSASAAVNDLYLPLQKIRPSEKHSLTVSRVFTILFGVIQIGVGIAGQSLEQSVIVNVMTISSFTIGTILGLFFLGVLTRRVSEIPALVGLVGGIMLLAAVKYNTDLAWPWFALVGASATFGIGLAASFLFEESTGGHGYDE